MRKSVKADPKMALLKRSLMKMKNDRDPSTGNKASGTPQALNRNDKAAGMANDRRWPGANQTWKPNPTATIDKKSKVQYGQGH